MSQPNAQTRDSIAVSPHTVSVLIGGSEAITVTGAAANSVNWQSTDPAIASVAAGVVTGNQFGFTTVTASSNGSTASVRVWVSSPASSFAPFATGCPTAAQVAFVSAIGPITFEGDPTAGSLVCTAAGGSADLTLLQRRVYTALLGMPQLRFTQAWPWTPLNLFEWFTDQVKGIRLRHDISLSSCCEPAGVINIQTVNLAAVTLDNSQYDGYWAGNLVTLFVHEARHIAFGPHTCGSNDNTITEEGAWGVQYQVTLALSTSPLFTGSQQANFTRDAANLKTSRFCGGP